MKIIVFQSLHQVIGTPKRVKKLHNLNKLLDLRSQNDIELHVQEVWKRGTRKEIENRGYKLAGFDLFKSEILAGLRRVKYKDLEDIVYRMELTYDEIIGTLGKNYAARSINGHRLPPGIYKTSDLNLMLKSLLSNEVKENNTVDDIRLRSNLTTNKTIKFSKISFFYTRLGFTQTHWGPLGDIEGFVQKITGAY